MADLVEDEEEMKVRGRPRLTDSDRTRRRLESRKKYDCRRVYLGEAHGAWVLRRDAGGQGEPWSDAKLATHLLALERHGKINEDDPTLEHHDRRRRPRVNNLQSLVTWFQDHMCQCPHEPGLSALDTNHALYVTAVWQCQAGHRFFQDLQCPFKKLNHLGSDEEDSDSSSTSPLEEALLVPCSPSEQTADTLYSTPVKSEIRCTEEESETVVCVPVGPETEELFQGVTQETLGQVVATSCPSQVIIIAGPGYEALAAEGIQLRVTEGSIGEDGACTTLEAVTAYTRTEVMDQELEQHIAVAVREDNTLYCLQRVGTEGEGECDGDDVQGQAEPASTLVHEDRTNTAHNKKTEKRKRKRCRALDGDRALKKFHCPYGGCSQVYTALNSFQNHVNLVHRKGRTKVCPEPGCGKSFYLSNHLHRHMIIHTDVREFICETCAKSFKRKSHLEVHRRTHTGETPLQCEVCGFQCRQRASLNWHMKKHQEELQYSFSCEHCGKLFEKQESVKFHKLKSHPDVMTA